MSVLIRDSSENVIKIFYLQLSQVERSSSPCSAGAEVSDRKGKRYSDFPSAWFNLMFDFVFHWSDLKQAKFSSSTFSLKIKSQIIKTFTFKTHLLSSLSKWRQMLKSQFMLVKCLFLGDLYSWSIIIGCVLPIFRRSYICLICKFLLDFICV